jgi:hypothetical protein
MKKSNRKKPDNKKCISDEEKQINPHHIRKKIEEILLQREQDKFFNL